MSTMGGAFTVGRVVVDPADAACIQTLETRTVAATCVYTINGIQTRSRSSIVLRVRVADTAVVRRRRFGLLRLIRLGAGTERQEHHESDRNYHRGEDNPPDDDRSIESAKHCGDGCLRIVVSSTALCLGPPISVEPSMSGSRPDPERRGMRVTQPSSIRAIAADVTHSSLIRLPPGGMKCWIRSGLAILRTNVSSSNRSRNVR